MNKKQKAVVIIWATLTAVIGIVVATDKDTGDSNNTGLGTAIEVSRAFILWIEVTLASFIVWMICLSKK